MHIETGAARAMENRLFRSMFEERKRVCPPCDARCDCAR